MKFFSRKAIVVYVAAGLILIAIMALRFSKPGYETVLNNYFKAIEHNDVELYINHVQPKFVSRYIAEGSGEEYIREHAERDLRLFREDVTGANERKDHPIEMQIAYSVEGVKKLSEDEMYHLMDHLYDSWGYFVYDGKDEMNKHITDAVKLFVTFTAVSEYETSNRYYPDGMIFIKEDGKWRLHPDY